MRPRGSVISQLLIVSCVFAVLIVIAAIAGYLAVSGRSATDKQLAGRYYVMQRTAGHMQESFNASQIAVSTFALTGGRAALGPVAADRRSFAMDAGILRSLAPGQLRGLVREQAVDGGQLFAIAGKITRLAPGGPAARQAAAGTPRIARRFFAANRGFQDYLAGRNRQLTSESKHALSTGLAWSGAAIVVAVLLVLAASLSTLRTITRPLRNLTATVRGLTAGDHAARARPAGSAEVREVAQAVNAQADEADRLRRQEADSSRLRATAREAGLRIREHLAEADVLAEACAALERDLDADVVYLRLLQEDRLGEVVGRAPGYLAPADVIRQNLTSAEVADLQELFRAQGSRVAQDLPGPDSGHIPPKIRDVLLAAGVVSHLLTPFGAGSDLLGIIIAQRLHPGHPWTRAEIDMVESVAADLGRGLNQARIHEAGERLVEDLKAVDRAKSDFFATISHELRAPLTSIEGYTEMMRDGEAGPLTSVQGKMLEVVDRNAGRLRNLIEDFLTLSKLESGAISAVTRPVDMAEVITGAVDAFRPSVAASGLTLGVRVPDRGLVVAGDPGQLDRVLMNLLSNAVKFTPEGGRVEVTAATEDSAAVVRVADTGIGVPEAERKQLFGRFFRATNARERTIPGTGLGLAIVQTIVASHRGSVWLDSREGTGTTVTMQLPLAPAGLEAAAGGTR